MNCKFCQKPIPKGFEVFWKKEPYHPDCVMWAKKATETPKIQENNNGRIISTLRNNKG